MAREDGRKGRDGECKEGICARQILVLTLDFYTSRMKEDNKLLKLLLSPKLVLHEL
jgi:hypothetical protein